MTDAQTSSEIESVLQLKVRLLGIGPMIWRRLLVPESITLHELHGILQVAMGWEGIHLFQFNIRGVMHAGLYLQGQPVGVPLSDFRFRRNGKFCYVYDMNCCWDHELRIEDRVPAVRGKRYPSCIGGAGACPPEDCGGLDGYFAAREDTVSLDAIEDIKFLAEIADQAVLQGNRSLLDDEVTRWRIKMATERCGTRARFLMKFHRGPVNKSFKAGLHRQLMHQQIT